jgi:hypothetical protein
MSDQLLQNLKELAESVERNTPIVEERLRRAGLELDPVLVHSIAKYWEVLERLSTE